MAAPASKRERLFTGIAVVVILGLALWLFLGRSPSGRKTVEVSSGGTVETDRGTVTVDGLQSVDEGAEGAPKAGPGHTIEAIRFSSCRTEPGGTVVDLSLFSVEGNGPAVPAEGSKLSKNTGDCVSGLAFVELPTGFDAGTIRYDADPIGVWTLPQD